MVDTHMFRLVREAIRREPDSFNMTTFANTRRDRNGEVCGTTACIAGHAALISGRVIPRFDTEHDCYNFETPMGTLPEWERIGREELDIGIGLADSLFFTGSDTALIAVDMLIAGAQESTVVRFLTDAAEDREHDNGYDD